MTVEADAPAYPQLVSPLTGEPVAQDLAPDAAGRRAADGGARA